MRVLGGLILWSLTEIGLFVVIGGAIGLLLTLVIVLGSAVLGVAVIRRQGMGAITGMRGAGMRGAGMRGGGVPLAKVGLTTLAGVLLILPGFLTDMVGLVLLVPMVQLRVIAALAGRVQAGVRYSGASDVVEGEAVEVEAVRLDGARKPSGWTREDGPDRNAGEKG